MPLSGVRREREEARAPVVEVVGPVAHVEHAAARVCRDDEGPRRGAAVPKPNGEECTIVTRRIVVEVAGHVPGDVDGHPVGPVTLGLPDGVDADHRERASSAQPRRRRRGSPRRRRRRPAPRRSSTPDRPG